MGKKHTPGPWELGVFDETKPAIELFSEALAHGSGPVHLVWCPKHPLTRGEHPRPKHAVFTAIVGNGPCSEANAALISAAPDMLEALKGALEWCHGRHGDFPARGCGLCQPLLAALNKAEGHHE